MRNYIARVLVEHQFLHRRLRLGQRPVVVKEHARSQREHHQDQCRPARLEAQQQHQPHAGFHDGAGDFAVING
mgnify:CR=1 FL=1